MIKVTNNSTSEQTIPPSIITSTTTTRGKGKQLNADSNYCNTIGFKDNINPSVDDINHFSYGSPVRSHFNINCGDQTEHINCQPFNNQLQLPYNQLFLSTCLPIQPTVNVYNQLNVNKINNSNNNNNVNSKYANHNQSNNLNASKLISSFSDYATTLYTSNEVNYDSVDSCLTTSKH